MSLDIQKLMENINDPVLMDSLCLHETLSALKLAHAHTENPHTSSIASEHDLEDGVTYLMELAIERLDKAWNIGLERAKPIYDAYIRVKGDYETKGD